jgi:hypothetical protein
MILEKRFEYGLGELAFGDRKSLLAGRTEQRHFGQVLCSTIWYVIAPQESSGGSVFEPASDERGDDMALA